ncbi:hypothetical protein VTN49DRAFT_975 [Thermomyces lanuginosus]|uniref:uncharacterized protein n=1 Tax=Thermomyces lanuginosus TaxID=5541 RepID=UPI0037432ABA
MGWPSRIFRMPRPRSFIYVMSLQTGASLITLSLLLNKISGLYGILAFFTGYHLSPVQLSMYIYSILALGLAVFLFPHIRKRSPLECLALAWFYFFDTVINAAYTAAFAVSWFLVVSQHYHNAPTSGPGSTIEDTSGFSNPRYNVSSVQVSGNVLSPAKEGAMSASPADAPAGSGGESDASPSVGNGLDQPESLESLIMICGLWAIRLYFVLVMFAFARETLHQQLMNDSQPRYNQLPTHSRNASLVTNADLDREPFQPHTPEGQGWQGVLGRAMTSVFRSYWLNPDPSYEDQPPRWMAGLRSRTHRRNMLSWPRHEERERRRRSGTGPPDPSHAVLQAASLMQPTTNDPPPDSPAVKLQNLHDR